MRSRSVRGLHAAAIVLVGFALAPATAQAEQITVYTAYEDDEAAAYLRAAKEDVPELDVNLVRLSTGDLTSRLVAEAGDPKHDVIWGQAVSNLVDPRVLATLEPYFPDSIDRIPDRFRDGAGRWFATTGYMTVLCVNHERLAARGLPMPRSWADLARPVYRGEVGMPDPTTSGTGYIQVVSILQDKGERGGWDSLRALDRNVARYEQSGSRPCNEAAAGRYAVGVSLAERALRNIGDRRPITMVIPSEGAGNELEGNALVASSRRKDAARRFLDWTTSERALSEYYKWKAIVTARGGFMPVAFKRAGLPADVSTVMFKMDYVAASRERAAILARWSQEFRR